MKTKCSVDSQVNVTFIIKIAQVYNYNTKSRWNEENNVPSNLWQYWVIPGSNPNSDYMILMKHWKCQKLIVSLW